MRTPRRVARIGGKDAGRFAQRAMNATMDRRDACHYLARLIVCPKGEPEHRADCAARTLQGAAQIVAEWAVIGHGCGNERMRDLQENGPTPAEKYYPLAVD